MFSDPKNKLQKLTTTWDSFCQQIDAYIQQGNELDKMQAADEDQFKQFSEAYTKWWKTALKFLEDSFEDKDNSYKMEFWNAGANSYSIPGHQKSLQQLAKDIKDTIKAKIFQLWGCKRILSVSEAVIASDSINLEERAGFSMNQKLTLILEKLHELYDDYYYPIEEIMVGNGIFPKRYDEPRELARELEDNGLVECLGGLGAGINVKITVNGARLVEQSQKPHIENYEEIRLTQAELNGRIDELKETLQNLGYGQEILFEELQELKEMYPKMNKKNWGQLVKGKLVDLAIGKIVENDTIAYIYEKITDHTLKLP